MALDRLNHQIYKTRRAFRRAYQKNVNEFVGWAAGQYPSFVLSDQVRQLDTIPVFVFHAVTRREFEPQLRFLAENGYRTLDADTLYERQLRRDRLDGKEVVLTFDDGHKSLWDVAFPLLAQYGFVAVAFIIPGVIPDDTSTGDADQHRDALCTWPEIEAMHRSGVIDFQSHSLYHRSISVSPHIADYVSPSRRIDFLLDDLFPVVECQGEPTLPATLPLGTPLYEWRSRFESNAQYLDSHGLRQACVDFVQNHGSERFFDNKTWRQQLDNFVRRIRPSFAHEARFESAAERREAIAHDLAASKRAVEGRLVGKTVSHFCYPWYVGDRTTAAISHEVGYKTNFWGSLVPRHSRTHRCPLAIPRLNPDYIWRLPGKERKPVKEFLQSRYRRLFSLGGLRRL